MSRDTSKKLLTWKQGDYSEGGYAGRINFFSISYRTISADPRWKLQTQLPGLSHRTWKSDDKDELKATAERVLAGWLEHVQGGTEKS